MYGVSLRDELFCYLMSFKISKQNIPGMYERTCQNLFPTSLPFRVLQITTYYHPLSTILSLFQPFRSVRLLSLWQEGFATHDCLTFLTVSLSLFLSRFSFLPPQPLVLSIHCMRDCITLSQGLHVYYVEIYNEMNSRSTLIRNTQHHIC